MINQDIIAQDLFYKIRSRFPKMEMGDSNGQSTFEATKGRFFDFDAVFENVNLGTVSISINEPGSLKLYFSRNILENADEIVSQTWYKFLKEMRKFAMKRLMSFDTRDVSKTNLDKRDFNYLAKKESVMNESAMRGTSRTSYKPLEKTKLIIRHSKPVDESIPGARSRNIEALFIENAVGERFKYPFPHKVGAECMQRHVANGGVPHDPVGEKIIEMSSDIAKLNAFKRYVYKEDLMNHETNHIVDRANAKLQNLKEKMQKLTKQHHYEAFKHSIENSMGSDQPLIDEITMEDFKDKFTVKSFKEDIAEVFPLLYRIMQEESELDLEDVVGEGHKHGEYCDACDRPAKSCVCDEKNESVAPELAFEDWANTLVETRLTPEDLNKLKSILSEHFPVGINGTNVTSTMEQLGIELDQNLVNELALLSQEQGPDANAKNLILNFLNENQPEIYDALGMQPEQPQPVQENSNHPIVVNGKEVDIRSLEVDGVDTRDSPDFSDAYFSSGSFTDGTEMSDEELEMLANERGDLLHELVWDSLHEANHIEQQVADEGYYLGPEDLPDWKADAAERVANGEVDSWTELYSELVSDLGIPEQRAELIAKSIFGKDNMAQYRQQADDEVSDLDTLDDEDDDDAFLSSLRGNIGKHGKIGHEMDEEDKLHDPDASDDEPGVAGPHEPKGHDPKEVAKFIMGFYDKGTNQFPLGEEGVRIKVEKQFGDKAGELAEKLIQRMAFKDENKELAVMKRLSGMQAHNEDPVMHHNVVGEEFAELRKLAGLK